MLIVERDLRIHVYIQSHVHPSCHVLKPYDTDIEILCHQLDFCVGVRDHVTCDYGTALLHTVRIFIEMCFLIFTK